MSTIKDTLNAEIKVALKAGDANRKLILRGLMAAVKQIEIDSKTTLGDKEVLNVIQKEVKSQKEVISDAEKADRPDLKEAALARIAVIEVFLPQQMSAEEITSLAKVAIAETGASHPKDMGLVMQTLVPQTKGRADGKQVSGIVSQLLRG